MNVLDVGSGITIGSSTIASGTSGRVLYDNAGVIGELAVTGSGSVVLADSPSLTTVATLTRTSVDATSTDGLVVTNTTAAAAGAQQFSPRIRLTGQGWKTNAPAESQTVDWVIENQPVQGAANPSSNLVVSTQINGGGYSSLWTLTSAGKLTSNIAANLDWFNGSYAGTDYIRLGFNGTSYYGLFNGSVYASTQRGFALGNKLGIITSTSWVSANQTGQAFLTVSNASDTTPFVKFESTGLTTKPMILMNQSTSTTALPIEIQLNAVSQFEVSPSGSVAIEKATAIPAGGTDGKGYKFSSTANFGVFFGSGAPTLAAAKGSLYLRSDGTSTSTRAYINTDGLTTWTSITTAA